ncbi:MAG: hypothetical protein A3I66_18420 [Burkholderiales bacterium RIFCSPLOWO2_02_FULL_57_36]|nr:MAG: hypothetical protein A3I66_18420 [Burkholderiales bacterium RIFCSPLOWO2_02_FULL_57_36]
MQKFPATLGWLWIKEGFALFRKQPAELSTLFLSYFFLMIVVGIIPFFGQLLPLILIPTFSMAFMQACADVEQGKRVYPNLLLTGFRSPAFITLLKLGGLYVIAASIAISASSLIDGGVFFKAMTGQITLDAETVQGSNMSTAMLFAAAVYLPAAMAFWYAAPLITWQKMGLMQAIFYSFFSVRRAGKAFLVYGFAWIAIGVLLPVLVSGLIGLLTGKSAVTMIFLMTMSMVMTVIMYCSFYPTYTHLFAKPDAAGEIAE